MAMKKESIGCNATKYNPTWYNNLVSLVEPNSNSSIPGIQITHTTKKMRKKNKAFTHWIAKKGIQNVDIMSIT